MLPRRRAENLLLGRIVHGHRNPQHRRQGNQIAGDMPAADRPVIRPPGSHHPVHILEIPLPGEPGREPGGGPRGTGAPVQGIMHRLGQIHRPSLGNLNHRPLPLHQIDPAHGAGHAAPGKKVRGISSALEIAVIRRAEIRRLHAGLRLILADLPERLDTRPPVQSHFPRTVEAG